MAVPLEPFARPLLVLHAVLGSAVVGSATHLAVTLWLLARGRESQRRAAHRFALIAPLLLVAQLLLGLVIYPAYRVQVRLAWLDEHAPGAMQAFENKEHLAIMALPLIVAASVFARRPHETEGRLPAALLAGCGALCTWTALLIGFHVTAVKAIGGAP
jgi:hypothetical protein